MIDESFRPQVFLYRACWHIGVANDAALALAQITGLPEGQCSEVHITVACLDKTTVFCFPR
jgi:predicted amidohydrolase YtcJ